MNGGYLIFDFGRFPIELIEGSTFTSAHVPGGFKALSRAINGKPLLCLYSYDLGDDTIINMQAWCSNARPIQAGDEMGVLFNIQGIAPDLIMRNDDIVGVSPV